jgi:type VI secretion system protein ImpC
VSEPKTGGIKSFNVKLGKGSDPEGDGPEIERGSFRIVVLSELTARPAFSTAAPPSADPITIDKLSFDQAMATLAPTLAIEVDDPIVGGAPMRIDLRFSELKAFKPDLLVDQVPPLRALVEARKIVQGLKERRIDATAARTQLVRILPRPAWADSLTSEVGIAVAPRTPATSGGDGAPKGGGALDSLLDKVEIGAPPAESAPEPAPEAPATGDRFANIVAAVAKSVRGPEGERPRVVVGTALERVERAFARLLSDILQHPEVRRLEEAWRGVRLLVDRCDFRAGVEVSVVSVDAEGVAEALERLARRLGPESTKAPIDLLIVDQQVGTSQAELKRLEAWASIGAVMRAPIVTNGVPAMLGVDSLEALATVQKRLTQSDDPRALAVRAAAAQEDTRWITLALNGVLVRAAYTAQTARLREVPFSESAHGNVFARPAFAIAALAAIAWVRTTWPCLMVGPRNGMLDNLSVHEVTEDGNTFAIPLETFVSLDTQGSVARAGLAMFSCSPNHDGAILSRAPMLYRGPAVAAGDAPALLNLGDQLFCARFSHAVEQLAGSIPRGTDPKAIGEVAQITFAELFAKAPQPHPQVDVAVGTDGLDVTVRPRGFMGVQIEEITLSAQLG